MGQYSHNNQPCHHILYLFALLGDRATTEVNVRKVMNKAYGPDFYAGDEDNGEQGAWFVLSALGLYVTTPGTTDYVLGSPLFTHVHILRADGMTTLDILAPNTNEQNVRVKKVMVNGNLINGPTVTDALLQSRNCVVEFDMEDISKALAIIDKPKVYLRTRGSDKVVEVKRSVGDSGFDNNYNNGSEVQVLRTALEHSRGRCFVLVNIRFFPNVIIVLLSESHKYCALIIRF
jgi:hypothetical protein